MWRDPHEVLNQNGDSHVLTLMPFPTPSQTTDGIGVFGVGIDNSQSHEEILKYN